ncbi:MAG: pilus assembly protein [Rhodospirillales bacterium]|nr:pilus assembly protein [Rhodospirillales bacterium]MBO6788731.1 pilus assembly protein [Rhodospirillales bacterium]
MNKIRPFGNDERGAIVVEFAIMLPFLILLVSGMTEVGRAYWQAIAVQKGVRAGALFAARADTPLSVIDQQRAVNLVRTGSVDGSGDLLVSGFGKSGASIDVATVGTFTVGTQDLPIIRVTAQVPFDPLFPNLFQFTGFGSHIITVSHEQAYVGD